MTPAVAIALLTLLAVVLMMGGELILSAFNEARLRARGAIEPGGDDFQARHDLDRVGGPRDIAGDALPRG